MSGSARRVCLDARLVRGVAGGVEQSVIGLAHGLSQLADGDEEYLFLTYQNSDDWLRPYLKAPCRLLPGPSAPKQTTASGPLKPLWRLFRAVYHQFSPLAGKWSIKIPHSDGVAENAGAALLHFTSQSGYLTRLPTIYQPWDLQHLHLPQFFTPRERLGRELTYRLFCRQASLVVVASSWIRQDVIRRYQLPEAKVKVIPLASPLTIYHASGAEKLRQTVNKYNLPDSFIFYPAQTWAHKNHLNLLDSLALLRDQSGLNIPLVCSGAINESYFPHIEKRLRELNLTGQVKFLGYIHESELQSLYRLCRFMVFPSKFEGLGLPLLEAFSTGVPVACSAIAPLQEAAGEAALFFNPDDPAEMAAAIQQLWSNAALRDHLAKQGRQQNALYSWERAARVYRACYRRLAGWPLTDEDHALLSERP